LGIRGIGWSGPERADPPVAQAPGGSGRGPPGPLPLGRPVPPPRRGIYGFLPKVKDMVLDICLVVEAQADAELPEVALPAAGPLVASSIPLVPPTITPLHHLAGGGGHASPPARRRTEFCRACRAGRGLTKQLEIF